MELPIVLVVLFTFLSPFITAYFNRVQWSPQTKTLVAMAVSLVIAVLYVIMTGGLTDLSQIAVVAPVIFTIQQAIYRFFVNGPAKELELKTTSTASLEALGDHHPLNPNTIAEPTAPDADITVPIYSDTPAKG